MEAAMFLVVAQTGQTKHPLKIPRKLSDWRQHKYMALSVGRVFKQLKVFYRKI